MVLQEIGILLITFLGYPIGKLLARLSKEEVNDKVGKKYFLLLRNLMLIAVAITLLTSVQHSVIGIFLSMIILIFLYYSYKKTDKMKENFTYILLIISMIVIISAENSRMIFLVGSFTFIYLLASVALLSGKK